MRRTLHCVSLLGLLGALALPVPAQVGAMVPSRPLHGGELADLQLSGGEAQLLAVPAAVSSPVEIRAHIAGQDRTLRLSPHSLRAPDFQVRVQGEDGSWRPATPPALATVRGEIVGVPGSVVAGSVTNGRLQAIAMLSVDDAAWGIEPLADSAEHAVFPWSDIVDLGARCGPGGFAPDMPDFPTDDGGSHVTAPGSSVKVCEIACDTDREFYQHNGSSVAATTADIEAIMNTVDALYLATAGVTYEITTVLVRTAEPDPFSSTDDGDLLAELWDEWENSHGNIERDLAHLFTGKNLDGSTIGTAIGGGLCHPSWGLGLSQTNFSNVLATRASVVSHELGHNWSAGHCNGDPDCATMCSTLGACGAGFTTFGAATTAKILAKKASVTCLDDGPPPGDDPDPDDPDDPPPPPPPPLVSGVSPTFGPSSGGTQIVITGSNFVVDPATTVRMDGATANIVSLDDDTIVVTTPAGIPGKRVDLVVDGPTGADVFADAFVFEWTIDAGDDIDDFLSSDDIDRAFFQAVPGTRFKARILGTKASEGLIPGIRLVGPGEVEVFLDEDDPQKPKGKALVEGLLQQTGVYRLEVYTINGTSGSYQLRTHLKPPSSSSSLLTITPSEPTVTARFGAFADAQLRRLEFTAKKAKPVPGVSSGPLLPQILELRGPNGPIDVSSRVEVRRKGRSVRIVDLPLDAFGSYEVTLGGVDGSFGLGKLRIVTRQPKTKSVKYVSHKPMD